MYFGNNLKLLSCQYLLFNKVSKQKFVAEIRDSYWLFVWGERDEKINTKDLVKIRQSSGFVVSELLDEFG